MQISYKYFFYFIVFCSSSCKSKVADDGGDAVPASVVTPATVTDARYGTVSDFVLLNATSTFLQKSFVKSNMNGYVHAVNVKIGSNVSNGQNIFSVKTKESESLGNAITKLDSSFKFSGTGIIKANANGYITELDHQAGDYVQDGEQLAVISNAASFAFILNLPYELNKYVQHGESLEIMLPDDEKFIAVVSAVMPQIDSVSQTEKVVLKLNANQSIPENLIAKVKIIKSEKQNALLLPKAAILSDETENNFWVMKVIGDTMAIKIAVKKGIETQDKVEILSPTFAASDKILLTGNYGLEDSSKVKIQQ